MSADWTRRQFVGGMTAGVLGGGMIGQAAAGTYKRPASVPGAWTPPTDGERKRLVGLAQFGRKQGVSGQQGVAVSTHPLATAAAIDMLKLGGSAVDAICAASMAQVVVEPHMTTLSGVFSMLHFDAATGAPSYVNGSANIPKSHPALKASRADVAKMLTQGQRDGTLCPVPGFWGGFEAAHGKFGKLPMATVMAPAIHYARHGFEIHPFLWGEMFVESPNVGAAAQGREMYFRDNTLLNVGDKLVQSRHADTLERLAEEGSDYFYGGEFARKYAAAVQAAGGFVTEADMAEWQVMWDEPVRSTYRDHEIIGSPAPDFGGQALIEIMNMVELMDLQAMGPAYRSPETTFRLMQIIGQVYADATAGRFAGTLPSVEEAISKDYAARRFADLSGPPKSPYESFSVMPPPGSNHLTVVDGDGNVATVLHSVMSMPYTTKIYVDGVYACAGLVHLGSGIPGEDRRIHARICPNMFLKNGKPVLASGSPSVSLTETIVQNSINMLDFGLDIETSVHQPRFGGSDMRDFTSLMIEPDMGGDAADHLRRQGAKISVVNPWSWTQGSFDGIRIDSDGRASACGDPRRTAHAMAV